MWSFWIKLKNKIRFSWSNVIPAGFFTLFAATLKTHCSGWTDPHMPWNHTSQPSPQALLENSKVSIRLREAWGKEPTYPDGFWQLWISKALKPHLWCLFAQTYTHTSTHTCTHIVIEVKICKPQNVWKPVRKAAVPMLTVWGGKAYVPPRCDYRTPVYLL